MINSKIFSTHRFTFNLNQAVMHFKLNIVNGLFTNIHYYNYEISELFYNEDCTVFMKPISLLFEVLNKYYSSYSPTPRHTYLLKNIIMMKK